MMNNIIDILEKEYPTTKTKKRGFPNIGKRADGRGFSNSVKEIEKAWYFYDTELYDIELHENTIKLGSGNPIKSKAFPLSINYTKKQLSKFMYEYPSAAGDEKHREIIAKYLIKEGYPSKINYDNVIITNSTTEAFYLIIKSIFKPYDVIIMTAPNYGLFTFMPERNNINVETIDLKESENFRLNPEELDFKIKKINKKLEKKYKNKKDYIPRVKAFLNINPHNPLGIVLSKEDEKLLSAIGEVCKNNNVFIIDDLIYRDITYDRSKIAKPIGTLEKYFDNTLSLYGLSKSYGLAKARSGFIIANEKVIRLLRDNLFYIMDSASSITSSLLVGAYNPSKKRYRCYKKYFKKIIKKYIFNYYICLAMFEGIDKVKNTKYYKKIFKLIQKCIDIKNTNIILEGIPYVKIVLKPQSGYFLLVNFTEIKNYSRIKSEKELLDLLYRKCGIKFLVGQSFNWPNKNELIARITYSLNPKNLICALSKINLTIREEFYETNRNNNKS